jgi:nucleotide-binding universal stress UspA family protein
MATGRILPGCIVAGIDAGGATDRAVDWAADQAALEGRHLHLVHGTEPRPAVGSASAVTVPADAWGLASELETTGRAILGRATTRAVSRHPELVVHQTLRTVEPGRLLVDLSLDAAMVVVGSRGRGHVLRLALGSVSEDVAERASCPVVVLRPRHDDSPHDDVLVAVDDPSATGEALAPVRFALRQAAVRRQPVRLMLTRPDERATATEILSADRPELAAEREALLAVLAAASEHGTDVPVSLLVGRGAPAECILALAGSVDLVVVGHHADHPPGRLGHGSVALDILDNAPATVAVVPVG